jgi:hypothetical protein
MKVLNETPAIFDLSLRWKPPENRPMQEPGADTRSAFDFPAFDLPTEAPTGGGDGMPEGYTFVEMTGCDSGSPYTYWTPQWPTNPEA